MMSETLIDLLRHGEPVGGTRFRGRSDDPLCGAGWEQMRGATAGAGGWDVIVTSPLLRCAEFSAELAAHRGLPLETEERFQEIGFGTWEGRTAAEIADTEPMALERFWLDPVWHTPPGGERFDAFRARVAAGWNGLLKRHTGKKILLVSHGGVIRLIIAQVLSIPPGHLFRLEVPFASASRIRVRGNETAALPELVHLGGSLAPFAEE